MRKSGQRLVIIDVEVKAGAVHDIAESAASITQLLQTIQAKDLPKSGYARIPYCRVTTKTELWAQSRP